MNTQAPLRNESLLEDIRRHGKWIKWGVVLVLAVAVYERLPSFSSVMANLTMVAIALVVVLSLSGTVRGVLPRMAFYVGRCVRAIFSRIRRAFG